MKDEDLAPFAVVDGLLAPLSSGTRMLDVMIINVLDQLAQAVDRLERNQPPGPDKV